MARWGHVCCVICVLCVDWATSTNGIYEVLRGRVIGGQLGLGAVCCVRYFDWPE